MAATVAKPRTWTRVACPLWGGDAWDAEGSVLPSQAGEDRSTAVVDGGGGPAPGRGPGDVGQRVGPPRGSLAPGNLGGPDPGLRRRGRGSDPRRSRLRVFAVPDRPRTSPSHGRSSDGDVPFGTGVRPAR